MTPPLPAAPGTYVLLLRLEQDTRLRVGRLGTFDFPAGYYAYVGSAFGAGGLGGRLRHHLRPAARPHWHVDYLRPAAALAGIWLLADTCRREHEWAAACAGLPGAALPAPGFGASDCGCAAHLFWRARPFTPAELPPPFAGCAVVSDETG